MTRPLRARDALLGTAVLLLAACATPPPRPPLPTSSPAPVPAAPEAQPAPTPATPTAGTSTLVEASPWPRLRRLFASSGCDSRPEVRRWIRDYTKSPHYFTASWSQAMPFLLLVVDELERRNMPGEFAMLPYIESGYRPVPSSGDRPAGMWQLVPDTARAAGLAIGDDYDGRLDAQASTTAALDLLTRYQRLFADWRLANMAFNSGEYRARRLLGERDPRELSAEELGQLAFSAHTHEHMERLLALACIIDDPQRFGVSLPEPDANDRLQSIELETGMDLRLAARLAGVPLEQIKRLNAGHRRNRMHAAAPHRLLMPGSHVPRFRTAAEAVPASYWNDWREERAARSSGIGSWAAQLGVPIAVLAAANAVDANATVHPTTRLLLPGREPEPAATDATRGAARAPRVHVVAAGETLSHIAQRHAIPIDRLKRLNPRARTLHPGDRLRLDAN